MWILIRLLLALTGYTIRQLAKRRLPEPAAHLDGHPIYERLMQVRRRPALGAWSTERRIVGFEIGMPRRSPTWLRMHAESAADRLFKRLGLANEVQTGDAAFDDAVYVACDHPAVHAHLADTPALRAAVLAAFAAGYDRIRLDGELLWMARKSDAPPDRQDFQLLRRIHAAAEELEDEAPSQLADPFVWRVLVIEGVIWAIAGYAVGAALELAVTRGELHFDTMGLVLRGLAAAGGALALLLAVIVATMRGSSRGHRIIIESAIVLVLSLPFTSIQVVADTNRALDAAPATVSHRIAEGCEHRAPRRSRRNTRYYLHLAPVAETPDAWTPSELRVTRALCDAVTPGASVELDIKPGRWGLPWYREIRVGGATLRPGD